jgi:hypothetical protein
VFREIERLWADLHKRFDTAAEKTKLPDRPDYEKANALLLKARESMV